MHHLRILFATAFFFSAHLALLTYVNSSTLARFLPQEFIGLVYVASALISLLLLWRAPRLLRKFGNWKITLSAMGLSIMLLTIIGTAHSALLLVAAFIGYFALNTLTFYLLDVFIEHYSPTGQTGNIRGFYLTLANLAWIGAPFITGKLVTSYGFNFVYFIAALLILPSFFLIKQQERHFKDTSYPIVRFTSEWKSLWRHKKIRTITILNFVLQFFYVWMTLYTPLYLISVQGFSWKTIGVMFSIMLLPFIIFQYPAGRLADKYLGEKELLLAGFLLMAVAALAISFVGVTSIFTFTVILFVSRIGASITEVMCESYFFKQVSDRQTVFISFYRDMVPLAYIAAPLLGTLILAYGSYILLFQVLAVILLVGLLVGFTLKDTR